MAASHLTVTAGGADGGRSALDWAVEAQGVRERVWEGSARPVLLLVPGLTGTSAAGYVRRGVAAALQRGWACAVVNHRGLGGVPLSSPHVYSAGFTGDVRLAVQVRRPPRLLLLDPPGL
jgi:abhydrolase domain-containing protein 1/3